MICIGKIIMSQVLCGDCGKPMSNCMEGRNSAFIVGSCRNAECESCGIGITIERSSMQVIAVDATPYSADGKRIFSVMADKDGVKVWPKPQEQKMTFSGWKEPGGMIEYHLFQDRNSPADNSCVSCGFPKEDVVHAIP